jgi:hypothetical protein
MSAHWDNGLEAFIKKLIDLSADTVKVRLMRTSAYTFSQTHQFASSLPATIVADVTLGSKTTNGAGSNPGCFDAADAVFAAVPAGAAIDCAAIYQDTGVAGTSRLIAYLDGFSVTPNGGDITLQWANAAPFIFKV